MSNLPPQNLAAERDVIAAMLRQNSCIGDVLLVLTPGHFYNHGHQVIVSAIADLHNSGKPVDLVALANILNDRGQLVDAGGPVELANLWQEFATAANVMHHAKVVRERWVRRRLIGVCTEIAGECFEAGDTEHLLESAERRILEIGQQAMTAAEVVSYADLVRCAIARQDQLAGGNVPTGLPTGFAGLDRYTGGFHPGEFVIVAARPSTGKTALALEFAEHAAQRTVSGHTGVYIASLEMSADELIGRALCATCKIGTRRWRQGTLRADERERLFTGQGDAVASAKVWVDEQRFQLSQICASIRRAWQKHKVALAIIDYLQLVETENRRVQRYEAVGEITRRLKLLAKELRIPIVALAQLGRSSEERPDGEPELSDIRESGNCEQDADTVLLLYRPKSERQQSSFDSHKVMCKIAKARHGPTGYVALTFNPRYTSFTSGPLSDGEVINDEEE